MEAITRLSPFTWEGRIIRDHQTRCIHLESLPRVLDSETVLWTGVVYDITERKRVADALRESEERLRLANKATNDVVWDWDVIHDTQQWNESGEVVFGWTDIVECPQSAHWWVERVHPEDLQRVSDGFFAVVNDPEADYWQDEYRFRRIDGSYAHVIDRGYVLRDKQGKAFRMIGAMLDITDRKRTEEALRESEDRYRSLFDNSLDAVLLAVPDGRILEANPAACRIFGRTQEEICRIGRACLLDLTDPRLTVALEERDRTGQFRGELVFVRKDGTPFLGDISSAIFKDHNGNAKTCIIIRDMTEKRKAERDYQILFREMLEGFALHEVLCDAQGQPVDYRFLKANPAFERMTGLKAKEIVGRTVLEVLPGTEEHWIKTYGHVALTGEPTVFENYSKVLDRYFMVTAFQPAANQFACIFVDITARRQAEEELKASRTQLSNALEMAHLGHWEYDVANDLFTFNDQFYKIFRTTVEQVGGYTMRSAEYARRFVHPDDMNMVEEETRQAVETTDPNFNRQIEHRMLYADGMPGYISVRFFIVKDSHGRTVKTYGVNQDITVRRRTEIELEKSLKSLRNAISTTIQVMVSAVETRDPYTAGHQIRSADLARAIATEMGFSQEKIEGIRLAASIHDIGKLSIPAEILSKPTKLSEIEFSLIKEHATKGFEMLKDVESPWPLAQIVHQHHERMNGTGYPQNLKGDDILIEARILSVADVVEAMASHRPYRPGLGLEAALEEIEKNKGIFYDDAVVDSCLRLFREKGFQLGTS